MGRVGLQLLMATHNAMAFYRSKHGGGSELSDSQRLILICSSVGLVLMAGLMSGGQ